MELQQRGRGGIGIDRSVDEKHIVNIVVSDDEADAEIKMEVDKQIDQTDHQANDQQNTNAKQFALSLTPISAVR